MLSKKSSALADRSPGIKEHSNGRKKRKGELGIKYSKINGHAGCPDSKKKKKRQIQTQGMFMISRHRAAMRRDGRVPNSSAPLSLFDLTHHPIT
jgi:hypothetical protein